MGTGSVFALHYMYSIMFVGVYITTVFDEELVVFVGVGELGVKFDSRTNFQACLVRMPAILYRRN